MMRAEWDECKAILLTRWPRVAAERWMGLFQVFAKLSGRRFKQVCLDLVALPAPETDEERRLDDLPLAPTLLDLYYGDANRTETAPTPGDCPFCDDTGFVYALRVTVQGATPKHVYVLWLPGDARSVEDIIGRGLWPEALTDIATQRTDRDKDACIYRVEPPFALRCKCAAGQKIKRGGKFYADKVAGDPVPIRDKERRAECHHALFLSFARTYGYPAGHRWAGFKPDEVPRRKTLRDIEAEEAARKAEARLAADAVREAAASEPEPAPPVPEPVPDDLPDLEDDLPPETPRGPVQVQAAATSGARAPVPVEDDLP